MKLSVGPASDIVSGIVRRCEAAPDRLALEHDAECWTYGELASELAHWREAVSALPGQLRYVALEFGHGPRGIAALLGVLAAGRCAVPLDPRLPAEQKAAVYSRTQAVTLTESGIGAVPDAVHSQPDASSPAGVLYFSSGTTGEPKGVLWPGRTLLKAARVFGEFFELSAEDRHALIAPLSVAAVLAQVTGTLLHGGTLVLKEARSCSIHALAQWLEQARISTLQTVPSLFRSLVETRRPSGPYPRLRAVKLGGEGVTAEDAEGFTAITLPGAVLVNGLGLTEAGFNVCWRQWRVGEALAPGPLPVGRPAHGVDISLETAEGRRLGEEGTGGEGEIVIRSPDLPAGYWEPGGHRGCTKADTTALPELRTGDAGRRAPGGELLLTGRLDRRLKIRGHAVQPEDIEQTAQRLAGVTAAAVTVDGAGPRARLVLFIETTAALSEAAVQRELARWLPEPARPARVLLRESLPRLAFGKLDRRALAASLADAGQRPLPSAPPRESLARTLAGLFATTLRRGNIPPDASFFDLGGDSLAAAELFTGIERVLGVDLPLLTLREHPSVDALCRHLREGGFNPTDHPVALLTPSPDAAARPVFAWTGAGSDVLALAGLAQHLGPAFALYAIQHRGADGRRVYDQSVEQMARRGLQWVRRIQPEGPYRLCGSSFGGVVALEAARQLRAAGESRVTLSLFDTYGPAYPRPRAGVSPQLRLQRALRALRPIGRRDTPGAAVLWQGLKEKLIRWRARRMVRTDLPEAPRLPMHLRYIYLQEACFAAFHRYRFAPYEGPVTLFRVSHQPSEALFEAEACLGLGQTLRGPLRLERVEAPQHGAHLLEPWVRRLAAGFAAVLNQEDCPGTPPASTCAAAGAATPVSRAGPAHLEGTEAAVTL